MTAKWPFQTAIYFDWRLRTYNPRPSTFRTRDEKNIVIERHVVWKIRNPDRLVQTVGDATVAEMRLHDTTPADRAALERYGINIVDARIKRSNLPERNRQSVYARMRAERQRIARQYRAEGDRQKEEILSAAYKQAENVKGQYLEAMEQVLPRVKKVIVGRNANLDLTIIRKGEK